MSKKQSELAEQPKDRRSFAASAGSPASSTLRPHHPPPDLSSPTQHGLHIPTLRPKRRFPFEVFSAGAKPGKRVHLRRQQIVAALPETKAAPSALPCLQGTVRFEEMERLKQECRAIILSNMGSAGTNKKGVENQPETRRRSASKQGCYDCSLVSPVRTERKDIVLKDLRILSITAKCAKLSADSMRKKVHRKNTTVLQGLKQISSLGENARSGCNSQPDISPCDVASLTTRLSGASAHVRLASMMPGISAAGSRERSLEKGSPRSLLSPKASAARLLLAGNRELQRQHLRGFSNALFGMEQQQEEEMRRTGFFRLEQPQKQEKRRADVAGSAPASKNAVLRARQEGEVAAKLGMLGSGCSTRPYCLSNNNRHDQCAEKKRVRHNKGSERKRGAEDEERMSELTFGEVEDRDGLKIELL